ncbi:MAG: hypothetical protein WCH07_10730 [Deltaproteobacteria bacterium]|jgi:hypothetical protein
MNVEGRITKLEEKVGVNKKPETLEDMLTAFNSGVYGQSSVMSVVASILSNGRV